MKIITECIELKPGEQLKLANSVRAISNACEAYLKGEITRYECVGIVGKQYCGSKDNASLTMHARVAAVGE